MSSVLTNSRHTSGQATSVGQMDEQISALGWLSFLASYCPLHKGYSAQALSGLFIPAINNNSVRFFKNDDGHVCAALIWARLSNEVSNRMVYEQKPPRTDEWVSGKNLWFLDVLAPFEHGRMIARHIARNPPDGPFFFARLNERGGVRKVVRGDATRQSGKVRAFLVDTDAHDLAEAG